MVTTKKKPLSDVGVFDYMTNVRILFNAAINEYNDDEKDEILLLTTLSENTNFKNRRNPTNEI